MSFSTVSFGEEMKITKQHLGVAASIALLAYLVALWSEAAYDAGGIGFGEDLTWGRMLAACRVTTFSHAMRLEMIPMGVVAVVGMLAAIAISVIPKGALPTWGVFLYTAILLISGSWTGLFVLVFLPFETLDGEFLAEGWARMGACGIWTLFLLAFLIVRMASRRKIIEPANPPYSEPAARSPQE